VFKQCLSWSNTATAQMRNSSAAATPLVRDGLQQNILFAQHVFYAAVTQQLRKFVAATHLSTIVHSNWCVQANRLQCFHCATLKVHH
jgi:hypothetical protein